MENTLAESSATFVQALGEVEQERYHRANSFTVRASSSLSPPSRRRSRMVSRLSSIPASPRSSKDTPPPSLTNPAFFGVYQTIEHPPNTSDPLSHFPEPVQAMTDAMRRVALKPITYDRLYETDTRSSSNPLLNVLGGPSNYEVDVRNLAKATGQREATPPPPAAPPESEDEEAAKAVKKEEEAPEGGAKKKKRKKKSVAQEYYDTNDPFIDDSELRRPGVQGMWKLTVLFIAPSYPIAFVVRITPSRRACSPSSSFHIPRYRRLPPIRLPPSRRSSLRVSRYLPALTDNVNLIAVATTAIARGDLTQKIGGVATKGNRATFISHKGQNLFFLFFVSVTSSMSRTHVEWIAIAIASLQSNGHGPTLTVQAIKDAVFEEARSSNLRFVPRRPANKVLAEALIILYFADLIEMQSFCKLEEPETEVTLTKDVWNELPSTHSPILQSVKRFQIHEAQIKRFNELVVFVDLDAEYSASDASYNEKVRTIADSRGALANLLAEYKELVERKQLTEAAQTGTVRRMILGLADFLGLADYVIGPSLERWDSRIIKGVERCMKGVERCMVELDEWAEKVIEKEIRRKEYIKVMQTALNAALGPGNHLLLMQRNEHYENLVSRD
ncbi:hypothetical protein DFP72DRAFT_853281 [Ephemerocybe angulata]|uniref:Hpc2-related domain-containing protein n=1 Tax=Ephemerocybe angulata TaxID=980116 RepID=A0A8H6HKC9_9AGAR|nr:hypothetical protein DFP72DRAFT_853281 [Tulosesus angulatus]